MPGLPSLPASEIERVVSEGLSPLWVSIHATDPDVRARMLRNRRGATSLRWLRALLDEARDATDRDDLSRVAELNSALHLAVIGISGNRWLTSIAGSMYLHVHWVFRVGAADRAPHSWQEHIRLIDAIAAGDPDEAKAAARSHVDAAAHAARETITRE